MPVVDYTDVFHRYQKQQRFRCEFPNLQFRIRRKGRKVIADFPSDIPKEVCLKCGRPATRHHSITLVAEKWVQGSVLLLLPFPFGLLYKAPEKCQVDYGLCSTHETARKRRIAWLTALTLLTPVIGIALMASLSPMWGGLILIS